MTDEDDTTPAEARAAALLGLLTTAPPVPRDGLEARVLRTARWQYTVRGTLRTIGDLSAALGQFAGMLAGGRGR